MIPTDRLRPFALFLSTALLVVACGSTTVSPTPSPTATPTPASASPTPVPSPSAPATPVPSAEAAAIYDAIEDQVVAIRDLDPTDVARETIDAATLKTMNAASFDEDYPPAYVDGSDRLFKAFGLIDDELHLRQLYLDLIDSQVAGFYRPDRKTLYVVSRSGSINGADKITFAHEYDHALQDAQFPGIFDEQSELLDQSDQSLARAAVWEGDATLLMSLWAISNLKPEEFQDVLSAGTDPESTAVLARTPAILVEGLLFPYNAGSAFIQPRQIAAGWAAVDDLYRDLPLSTEQVLHPEKYDAGEVPVEVSIPVDDLLAGLGSGWTVPLQDTFGEFQIGIWLRESGVPAQEATAAAAGWGGDRVAVLDGPGDAWAVVLRSAWDTVADAGAFEVAAGTAVGAAGGPAGVFPGSGGTTRWFVVGSDDATLGSVAGTLGLAG